jgi:thiol-disulfide isomerase/thioredoxin
LVACGLAACDPDDGSDGAALVVQDTASDNASDTGGSSGDGGAPDESEGDEPDTVEARDSAGADDDASQSVDTALDPDPDAAIAEPIDAGTEPADTAVAQDTSGGSADVGGGGGDVSITVDAGGSDECTGPGPILGSAPDPVAGAAPACTKEAGCAAPIYYLDDFQPLSCGYGATYGLDAFVGKPTLVVLLAAWCPFCRAQLEKLEELRVELAFGGYAINFVVVNKADAAKDQVEFTNRCSFPLLQDIVEVDAWGLHQGVKDDFFLYDGAGNLIGFYQPTGEPALNLTKEEGMQALRTILIDAASGE